MHCSICNKNIGLLASGRCRDGRICKDCWNSIPDAFLLPEDDVSSFSSAEIQELINYKKKEELLRPKFICTSSYGDFHLDSHHGLLYIGKSTELNNGLLNSSYGTVFDLRYLKSVSMSMDTIKITETQVDVFVKGSITSSILSRDLINIPLREDTAFSILDGDHVKFYLPYGASIMLNEIIRTNHALIDALIYEEKIGTMEGSFSNISDINRAKCLYMVHGDYTEQEIKKTRNKLVKAFHPDEGEEDSSKAEEIISCYDLLLLNLKNKKVK